MANPWVYGALERVPIEQKGGFRIPFTVVLHKSEISAVYLCAQHDTSSNASPFHTLRRVPGTSTTVPTSLGIRPQQVEFIDEWKQPEINRVSTMFVEKVTPAGRSVSTVTSLVVQYLSPQQTHNLLWRGEADNFPVGLLSESAVGVPPISTATSNRNGILQPFFPNSGGEPFATGVSFTWRADRPTTIVFPEPGSNEDGLVQWNISARRNTNPVASHTIPPYLRGVTVDGERTQSEPYALTSEEISRIQTASELLILALSKESPLIKVHFLFRFTGGYLYFLHAPLIQRRGEVMDTKVRFVVPRQFMPNAGGMKKGRGGSAVGEEDLLETPRIEVAITLPHDKIQNKKRLENAKRRKAAAAIQNTSNEEPTYPALDRKKQKAEEDYKVRNRTLASPCPDAPREHPEADPKHKAGIRQRNDVLMAKALLEALEGKKTIPISKIAARLQLSEKQTKYLQQLKEDSAASMDVTVSRAYSLEYNQTKLGRPASKGPKPEKIETRVSKVTRERQKRREAQQHSSSALVTAVGGEGADESKIVAHRDGEDCNANVNKNGPPGATNAVDPSLIRESSSQLISSKNNEGGPPKADQIAAVVTDVGLAPSPMQRPLDDSMSSSLLRPLPPQSQASVVPTATPPLTTREFIGACDAACVAHYSTQDGSGVSDGASEPSICDTGIYFHYTCTYGKVAEYVATTTTVSDNQSLSEVQGRWYEEVVPMGTRTYELSKLLLYHLHSEMLSGSRLGDIPNPHQRKQRGDTSPIPVSTFALPSPSDSCTRLLANFLTSNRTLRSFIKGTTVGEDGEWKRQAADVFRVATDVSIDDPLNACNAFPYEESTSPHGRPPGTPLFIITGQLPPYGSISAALDLFIRQVLRDGMVDLLKGGATHDAAGCSNPPVVPTTAGPINSVPLPQARSEDMSSSTAIPDVTVDAPITDASPADCEPTAPKVLEM